MFDIRLIALFPVSVLEYISTEFERRRNADSVCYVARKACKLGETCIIGVWEVLCQNGCSLRGGVNRPALLRVIRCGGLKKKQNATHFMDNS